MLAVDASHDLCWALVEPGPAKPPPLPELCAFMAGPPQAKVPITRGAMCLISDQHVASHFTVVDGLLAGAVGTSICYEPGGTCSEIDTVIHENTTVVQVTGLAAW